MPVVAAGLGVGGFCLYKRLRRSRVSAAEIEAERGARKMESARKAEERKAGASEAR